MTTELIFEPKPWKGAQLICRETNRPAFENEKQVLAYYAKYAPRCSIQELWLCSACNRLHVDSTPPGPSGDSSGTSRSTKSAAEEFRKLKASI